MTRLTFIMLLALAVFVVIQVIFAFLLGASECNNSLVLSRPAQCLRQALINLESEDEAL